MNLNTTTDGLVCGRGLCLKTLEGGMVSFKLYAITFNEFLGMLLAERQRREGEKE